MVDSTKATFAIPGTQSISQPSKWRRFFGGLVGAMLLGGGLYFHNKYPGLADIVAAAGIPSLIREFFTKDLNIPVSDPIDSGVQ